MIRHLPFRADIIRWPSSLLLGEYSPAASQSPHRFRARRPLLAASGFILIFVSKMMNTLPHIDDASASSNPLRRCIVDDDKWPPILCKANIPHCTMMKYAIDGGYLYSIADYRLLEIISKHARHREPYINEVIKFQCNNSMPHISHCS